MTAGWVGRSLWRASLAYWTSAPGITLRSSSAISRRRSRRLRATCKSRSSSRRRRPVTLRRRTRRTPGEAVGVRVRDVHLPRSAWRVVRYVGGGTALAVLPVVWVGRRVRDALREDPPMVPGLLIGGPLDGGELAPAS